MCLIVYSIRGFLLRINKLILIITFYYNISMMIIILFGFCVSIIILLNRGMSLILILICIFAINTIRLLWLEFRRRFVIIKVKCLVIIFVVVFIDMYISLY